MMEAAEVTVPARAAVEQLVACGVTHVVWLPDSESGFMYEALTQAAADGRLRLVPICREGEAVPLAFGLQLGGKRRPSSSRTPASSRPATRCAARPSTCTCRSSCSSATAAGSRTAPT